MATLDGNRDDYEILEPASQVNYLKNILNKSSKDFFGCDLAKSE